MSKSNIQISKLILILVNINLYLIKEKLFFFNLNFNVINNNSILKTIQSMHKNILLIRFWIKIKSDLHGYFNTNLNLEFKLDLKKYSTASI